jgi:AcrR family transcriptional regulator
VTTRQPGTNRRGRTSREVILRAAATTFADRGYRSATMAEIAAAAGLTQPGLLYHYPQKEDLLFDVMDRHLVAGVTRIAGAAERGSESVFEAFLELARANTADPEWVRLASVLMAESVAHDHPAHRYFRDRSERIARAMAAGLRDLEPNPERRLSIARVLNASWDGLRMNWLLDPSIDVVADLRLLVDVVRRGAAEPASASAPPQRTSPADASISPADGR